MSLVSDNICHNYHSIWKFFVLTICYKNAINEINQQHQKTKITNCIKNIQNTICSTRKLSKQNTDKMLLNTSNLAVNMKLQWTSNFGEMQTLLHHETKIIY